MLAIAQSMARMNRNGRVAVEAGRVYIGCMTIDRKMARKRDLVRIEMAERRLAEGGYGYCEECGGEIPDGRLAIDPMAERCVNCAGRPGVIPPVRPGRR